MGRFSAIPSIKLWRITLEDGRVFNVQGPTRWLAILNLRCETPAYWGRVKRAWCIRPQPKGLAGIPMVSEIIGPNPAKA